ncbi:hypothetical protein [Bifidobacterium aquikefiricola]|uniref:Uncharacterized protein n=1 Tax=Bifidobacterium aquikefiricola TaxID=3059038 RepID=A0AB39U5E2_9BIFI
MSEFVLQTSEKSYTNSEISGELLRDVVERLSRKELDFMVLEPSEPVDKSIYLQMLGSVVVETIGSFVVETRLVAEDGSFTQYSYTSADQDEVLSMFLKYWEHGELPDLDGWKDITASLSKPASVGLWARIRSLLRSKSAPAQIPLDGDVASQGMRH